MKPPDRIRIRLLGGFEIARDDGPAGSIRLSTKKVCALVAYLAMSRKQAASREELATLLWGSCSDQQARQSLRQALALLRRDLGSPNVLSTDKETVRLQPGIWSVDALEFEALAASSEAADLQRAADLFGGDFLSGFAIGEEGFDEWLRGQRDRVRMAAGRALAAHAERSDAAGNGEQAIAAVQRLLALDPLREDWQRLALRLYARHRGQHEALAQAKAFAALLQRELDVEPEPETTGLVERIRRGEIARVAAEPAAPPNDAVGEELPPPDTAAERERATDEVVAQVIRRRHFGPWTGAAVAAAVLLLFGGLLALLHGGVWSVRGKAVAVKSPVEATVTVDDPWRSPLPTAQPAASTGRSGGLVSVAVLPFTVEGEGGEASNIAAEIVTDDLTDLLSRVADFRVISRQTARTYRGQQVDPAEIGAELGVRYLLQGSVSKHEGRLRVNAELFEAAGRRHVWSGRFERVAGDMFAVEDEIVNSLGHELHLEVTQLEAHPGSKEPDVHELIFKGSAALFEVARYGLPPLQQAESYFAQALARDPDNPRALAGLGQYHVLMAVQLYAPDPARHLAKAESLLQQVIKRHPNMAWAHASMGLLNIARRRHEDAAKWYQRAIELNPSQAMSYAQLGRLLTRAGRPEEGLKHILYAMRLSPRDPGLSYWLGFAGAAEVELKRYDKAIEYLDRAVALHPSQPRTMLVLIAAHALAGNMGEARRRLDELQKSLPHLSHDKLVDRFLGDGTKLSQLREGLRQVLASPWDSPPLPSQQAAPAPSSRAIIPLIVLPFTTYGDNAGSIELLADVMTDDLINMLSRVPSIRVISRSFKGRPIDIAAIGAELQARYVLEGSMRMLGDKLRVNVELTDPSTRLAVWSGRIERAGADRQAVQDEIVGRLARELHFELYPVESARRSNDTDATRGRLSR